MSQGEFFGDASHLYEVERRVQHAARPGFRIMELQPRAHTEGAVAQPHQYHRYFLRFWKAT